MPDLAPGVESEIPSVSEILPKAVIDAVRTSCAHALNVLPLGHSGKKHYGGVARYATLLIRGYKAKPYTLRLLTLVTAGGIAALHSHTYLVSTY